MSATNNNKNKLDISRETNNKNPNSKYFALNDTTKYKTTLLTKKRKKKRHEADASLLSSQYHRKATTGPWTASLKIRRYGIYLHIQISIYGIEFSQEDDK